jgi:hypothetical protein
VCRPKRASSSDRFGPTPASVVAAVASAASRSARLPSEGRYAVHSPGASAARRRAGRRPCARRRRVSRSAGAPDRSASRIACSSSRQCPDVGGGAGARTLHPLREGGQRQAGLLEATEAVGREILERRCECPEKVSEGRRPRAHVR